MTLRPPLDDSVLAALVTELADAAVVADTTGTIGFRNAAAERTVAAIAALVRDETQRGNDEQDLRRRRRDFGESAA